MENVQPKTHKAATYLAGGLAVVIVAVVAYLGLSDTSLFRASLTTSSGSANPSGNNLYIPNNYQAVANVASDEVLDIKVGKDFGTTNYLSRISVTFDYDPSQLDFPTFDPGAPVDALFFSPLGTSVLALPSANLDTVNHKLTINTNFSPAKQVIMDAVVIKLKVKVKALPVTTAINLATSGAVQIGTKTGGTGSSIYSAVDQAIGAGKITVIRPVCTSASQLWTFVDFSTISCVSGVKTRTVTDIASPTCDNTSNIARPATTQNCVCTTAAADWTCDAWAPAICPTSGAQTRTCTANNCIDSSSLKSAMESQNCNLVACTEAQVWTCTAWPATCETSGTKTRTCTAVANPQCSNPATIAKPAETQDCVCTTAGSDWECTSWTPATCPQSGSQSRTCTAKNCKDTTARKAQMEAQTCTPPAVTNVTNCPATILATGAKARPNMLLKGPAGSMNWRLDGVVVSGDKIAEGGGSVKLSDLSVGTHSVTAEGGAPCTFTVGCYTSIETGNARRAVGSTDVAKLLLYDYDGNGAIDALDKKAIFEATKSCN